MRAAALLLVAGLLAAGCTSEPVDHVALPDVQVRPSDVDEIDPGPLDRIPDDAFTTTVYVDGWSQRIAGSQILTYTLEDDAFQVPLEPVDEAGVQALAEQWPFVAARAHAYLFTVDALTRCDDGSCRDGTGELPSGWLADPSQAVPMGPMFDGWQVDHGLWAAQVRLDPRVAEFSFAVGDMAPASFPGPVQTLEPNEPTSLVDRSAASSVFLLSAGWGQTFVTDPARWAPDLSPKAHRRLAAGAGPSEVELTGSWLVQGPTADPPVALSGVPGDLLTALSSPAFGCNGTLCVPQDPGVPVEPLSGPVSTDVCVAGATRTLEGADVRYDVDLTVPTHVRSGWASQPSSWPYVGPTEGAERPQPRTGPLSMRLRQILLASDALVSVATGAWQYGAPDNLTDAADADALPDAGGLASFRQLEAGAC